jgi:hypothetical protein
MLLRQLNNAEIAFCEEHGLDQALWAGQSFKSGSQVKVDGYQLFDFANADESPPVLNRIVVYGKKIGWANQVIRLARAILVARALEVPRVQIDSIEGFPQEFRIDSITVEGLDKRDTSPALVGEFFYARTLSPIIQASGTELAEIMKLLGPHCEFRSESPRGASTLTVHIRSGDIYSKKRVHSDYGQPPFGFIKKVLERGAWSDVVVVRENNRSPVVLKTIAYLARRKIPFILTGENFETAIAELFRAHNLVLSTGTFSIPALCMSQTIKNVYFFEEDPTERWGVGRIDAFRARFTEKTGLFVKLVWRPWKNSRLQRLALRRWPACSIRPVESYSCNYDSARLG